MKSKTIQNDIINLEAIQEGLDKANDINAIGLPRHLISEMIKEKKKNLPKVEKKSIHQRLYDWLQVLKDEFKSYESKDYDFQDGLSQCKTRKGCFTFGKIKMVEQILDNEI